jgi:hypothetical protein
MSFEIFGRKPKATIVKEDHKGKISLTEGFASVNHANNALTHHLGDVGAIVIEKDTNDYDGAKATALERTKNSRLWGENYYEVLPDDVIENGAVED